MPPSRPAWIVTAADAGTRLDKFLAAADRLGSRSRVAAALERGKIFIGDDEAGSIDAARRLREGDVIAVWMDRPGSAARRPGPFKAGSLDILFEDESLIVLNKPAGMLSVPLERRAGAESAYGLIEDHLRSSGKRRPLVVHRIDLDTSGLVIFAKTTRAQEALKAQFRRREPERIYRAVVYGHPEPRSGEWRDRLVWDQKALIQKATHPDDPHGAEAISRYSVLESFPGTSLIEVRLTTGKRNQIRIQARRRGHTLVGERRYVYGPETLRPIEFPRQALHAFRLSFLHPSDNRPLTFEAPLPPDLAELLARLRRQKSEPL
jgi:23S rRNA pseudouridine1911/1915/1917 synthase